MARRYGRARGGARCVGHAPVNTPPSTTVCSSVRLDGSTAWASWRGGTTKERFLSFVAGVLAPSLREGDLVVMDNLSAHRADGVAEAVEARGASVAYLPPYSPDLNPIEKMWSKVKASLRAAGARTAEGLAAATAAAMASVTATDCRGWFESCGYAQE